MTLGPEQAGWRLCGDGDEWCARNGNVAPRRMVYGLHWTVTESEQFFGEVLPDADVTGCDKLLSVGWGTT